MIAPKDIAIQQQVEQAEFLRDRGLWTMAGISFGSVCVIGTLAAILFSVTNLGQHQRVTYLILLALLVIMLLGVALPGAVYYKRCAKYHNLIRRHGRNHDNLKFEVIPDYNPWDHNTYIIIALPSNLGGQNLHVRWSKQTFYPMWYKYKKAIGDDPYHGVNYCQGYVYEGPNDYFRIEPALERDRQNLILNVGIGIAFVVLPILLSSGALLLEAVGVNTCEASGFCYEKQQPRARSIDEIIADIEQQRQDHKRRHLMTSYKPPFEPKFNNAKEKAVYEGWLQNPNQYN